MSHDLYAAKDMPDSGFFQANITSRRTSRPIAGAKIQIRNINDANDIIEETETNSAGKSDLITLPAPPLEYSMMPGTERPYSTYSIQITAPNFEPVEISGAEILSGQTALQNTTLIPKPNTPEANEELFVIPPHTLYEKYPPKIPEEEIKTVEETGEIVLSRVVIPAGVRTTCNILMVPNTSYHRSGPFICCLILRYS